MLELVSLLVGGLGGRVSMLEVVRVPVLEVSVGCDESVVKGVWDEEVEDEERGLDCVKAR